MSHDAPTNLALNYEGFFMATIGLQTPSNALDLGNIWGGAVVGEPVNLGTALGGATTTVDVSPTGGGQTILGGTQAPSGLQQGLGGASIGLAIGQAIGGMYAAWRGGKTLDYVAKQKAAIAEENRQMAQLSAESAYLQGQAQVAQLTYRAGQIKAKQRTAFAANGVVLGEGSSAETMASTDLMKEIDKRTAQMNAMSAAWGYKQQAIQASAQGGIYSGMSGYLSQVEMGKGFSSLLESGSVAADRWYRFFGEG